MSHVSDRFVVVLDACVLFPFRKADALLHFAEGGLFRARWSADILNEWQRALLRKNPHLQVTIDSQVAAMTEAFPEACVAGYEELIDVLRLPDPDDRHVLAAAIVADAEHIVTDNTKDFPPGELDRYGVEAVTADDFLASTFELYPTQAIQALALMRSNYRNPPFTPAEFILEFQVKGMPKVASLMSEQIGLL